MTQTWFTSDTHFGHKNILEYEKETRPFSSVEEMNEKIIDNWNKTVNSLDIIYHLGDFVFGRNNISIAERLNGRKRLILGNHDVYDYRLYLPYFERLCGAFHWKGCILTHIPVHPHNLGSWYRINVHGHLHSKTVKKQLGLSPEWVDDPNYFNVSVELHDLKPVHSDLIMERLKDYCALHP